MITLQQLTFLYNMIQDKNISQKATAYDISHNTFQLEWKNGKVIYRSSQINGRFLLEALLQNKLGLPVSIKLITILNSLQNGKLYGWWPRDYMLRDKKIAFIKFFGKYDYDVDDTAAGYRYFKKEINDDEVVKTFLSPRALPSQALAICFQIHCQNNHIIRVWTDPQPTDNEDMDIIATASFISRLNTSTLFRKVVFDSNAQYINYAIEHNVYKDQFFYYEPKVTGTFLLLFYDSIDHSFLSGQSRSILMRDLKDQNDKLTQYPLIAREGGEAHPSYKLGFNIVYSNKLLPLLMHQYAKKHFDI